MSPSAEWRFHLGPLDFSVGIRRFQLGGTFPGQLPAVPDAAASEPRPSAPAPGGRIRAAGDDVPDRETQGGTTG